MWRIYEKISQQATEDVEVICLIDNKSRTIGAKRDALVQMSRGDYIAFCDDDDDVSDDYIEELLKGVATNKDVICFWQHAIIDGKEGTIDFDLCNENREFTPTRMTPRKPYHVCAWRGDMARKYRFPDLNYDEDRQWLVHLWKEAKTQYKIGKELHTYIFDKDVSEAL